VTLARRSMNSGVEETLFWLCGQQLRPCLCQLEARAYVPCHPVAMRTRHTLRSVPGTGRARAQVFPVRLPTLLCYALSLCYLRTRITLPEERTWGSYRQPEGIEKVDEDAVHYASLNSLTFDQDQLGYANNGKRKMDRRDRDKSPFRVAPFFMLSQHRYKTPCLFRHDSETSTHTQIVRTTKSERA